MILMMMMMMMMMIMRDFQHTLTDLDAEEEEGPEPGRVVETTERNGKIPETDCSESESMDKTLK
jgi:hypothetical protein